MMAQQLQLQQIHIQAPGTPQQYINQQEHQQQIQNQLIHQQTGQLTSVTLNSSPQNIHQINIQPKPQILIGTPQTALATTQAQPLDNRPTIMSMVSIAGTVSSTNGSPLIQSQALQAIQGMASPPHITLQPPQNPLAAMPMTTLSYTASPTNTNKDDKQKSDQSKIIELHQNSSLQSLISLSTGTTLVTSEPTMSPSITSLANGDLSSQTNTVSTSSPDAVTSMDTSAVSGKNHNLESNYSSVHFPNDESAISKMQYFIASIRYLIAHNKSSVDVNFETIASICL